MLWKPRTVERAMYTRVAIIAFATIVPTTLALSHLRGLA
jgi:hypothetical protein